MELTTHSHASRRRPCRRMVVLLILLFSIAAQGQPYNTPSTGSESHTIFPGTSTVVRDPGGTSNYPNNCNGILTLVSSDGGAIHITGNYNTEDNYDYIYIYDGYSTLGTLLGTYSNVGSIDLWALRGAVTLRFFSDQTSTRSGYSFTVQTCTSNSQRVSGIVSVASDTTIQLSWSDNSTATHWTVRYGSSRTDLSNVIECDTTCVTLQGLNEHTDYYYRILNNSDTSHCASVLNRTRTKCSTTPSGCLDYTNFTSCHAVARYGTFRDPDKYTGVVDYGSLSPYSRHSVHSYTYEYDANTGSALLVVPTGFTTSVRLGNAMSNSEAESITYEYYVDTLNSDMLIMKYAAVLENPSHSAFEQPRFQFQIMDEEGIEINSSCYSATFVSNNNLGWNSYAHSTLWKDWTTVGVDLTPLHGQTIYIKLTTYDCQRGGHYGYAYYVLDCTHKRLISQNCGSTVENDFTAPEGFSYRWYRANNPSVTLDTSRTLHVTQTGEYRCNMQFIGAPAGATCSFELTAISGQRYPTARFVWNPEGTDSCSTILRMVNQSVVSLDAAHQQLTSQDCEDYIWTFDDGTVTTEQNPLHTFTPGQHSVSLKAMIGNGQCIDSVTHTFIVAEFCQHFDTIADTICANQSYRLFDTLIYNAGTYQRDSATLTRTLFLSVLPTADTTIADTIVENLLPYTFSGTVFNNGTTGYDIPLTAANGCDSTLHYSLHVWHNTVTHQDTSLCENQLPLVWNGITLHSDSSATITFSAAGMHGEDSSIVMSLTVLHNSSMTRRDTVVQNNLPVTIGGVSFLDSQTDTNWTIANAAGCDSNIHYSLHVWHNVNASADSTICENMLPLAWHGHLFSDEDSATVNLSSSGIHAQHGEDSILTMRLHVLRNSVLTWHDTVIENDLPVAVGGVLFYNDASDTTWTIANVAGCDSTIHYSLHVWHNYNHTFNREICDNMLPLAWCGVDFTEAGSRVLNLLSVHGADSIVTLVLTVNPTYEGDDSLAICDGQTSRYGYRVAGNYDTILTSRHGCDSLIHVTLTVNPVYHYHFYDTLCDNQSTLFDGETVKEGGHYESLRSSVDNCDSLLTLDLTVYPTNYNYVSAVVCDGLPFTWEDGVTYTQTTYEPTITYTNIHGCDSVLRLVLDLADNFEAQMQISPTMVSHSNNQVRLADISDSRRRTWFFDGRSDTNRVCYFTYPLPADSLSILLVAESTIGCIDSTYGTIFADKSAVWVPNAFTPDAETNSRFFIPSNDLSYGEVWIYDRKGLLVTHFDALTGSWDGTKNGIPCPQATYVWTLRYSTASQPNTVQQATGTVTLLR